MRRLLALIGFGVALYFGLVVFQGSKEDDFNVSGKLQVGETVVRVEIADDEWEHQRGFSGRRSLCEECGMLFVFDDSRKRVFWMKEMRFDLDMLFINEGRVVEIYENVLAPEEGQDGREIKVITKSVADMVLEVNSGWVEENNIDIGDQVLFRRFWKY